MAQRVLLVEPDAECRVALSLPLAGVASVDAHAGFAPARAAMKHTRYDLLVTNIRLAEFNGLHLIHVARPNRIRCVAYCEPPHLGLAREVQSAGAFYETHARLLLALPNYMTCRIPPADRRDPARVERRSSFRGGRRCSDVPNTRAGRDLVRR